MEWLEGRMTGWMTTGPTRQQPTMALGLGSATDDDTTTSDPTNWVGGRDSTEEGGGINSKTTTNYEAANNSEGEAIIGFRNNIR